MTSHTPPTGVLRTRRGEIATPVFVPDGTRAVVRGIRATDAAAVGTEAVLVSAAHVAAHPGVSVIRAVGGVHEFMNWGGPIIADSGGYQAFSLGEASNLLKVSNRGLRYRFSPTQRFRSLTPESSISGQVRIGADIVYCLDLCTPVNATREAQERSVELTIRWARECRKVFDRLASSMSGEPPLLFGVVQGGPFSDLRSRCAEELTSLGLDGYGFGGYPVQGGTLVDEVAQLPALLPEGSILHGLGIGSPENLTAAWRAGFGVFDCVLPSRNGRRGRLYVDLPANPAIADRFPGPIDILDERWVREPGPIDPDCDCPACADFSAAYLAHLFRIEDRLAGALGTLHNLRFYNRLIERLRLTRIPALDSEQHCTVSNVE